MKKEYEIKTLEDFIKLDESQIDACLRDFKVWIGLRKQLEGAPLKIMKLLNFFHWIDDGIEGISTASVVFGDTSLTTEFEEVVSADNMAFAVTNTDALLKVLVNELKERGDE